MPDKIIIKGARVHNLKNIDVEIPRHKFVVVTGLSGSGKSSLVFDTIYAEGQRRYMESISAYARQFLGLRDKPDVDQIEGLPPAISLDQRTLLVNPRSTVGTITEIYDYLRLLFSRVGHPHCPVCGDELSKQNPDQIVTKIFNLPPKTFVSLLAPISKDSNDDYMRLLEEVRRRGYAEVRVDGSFYELKEAENLRLDNKVKHSIEALVDGFFVSDVQGSAKAERGAAGAGRARAYTSVKAALNFGGGQIIVFSQTKLAPLGAKIRPGSEQTFSENFACPKCGITFPSLEPRHFSFNSPNGACPECSGLGTKLKADPDLIIPNKKLTLAQGAIRPWVRKFSNQSHYLTLLGTVAKENGFSLDVPVEKLTTKQLDIVLYGVGDGSSPFEGVIPNLEATYNETTSDYLRTDIERYMRVFTCPTCKGKRLRKEFLAITVGEKNISEISAMNIGAALEFFSDLCVSKDEKRGGKTVSAKLSKEKAQVQKALSGREHLISHQVIKEIKNRLEFLRSVGLSYLTLDRTSATLAGGELQRIRLSTQISAGLVEVLYILDEPSIGLHQRDNAKLIQTLKDLRDKGNSVLVVEHDEETMLSADYIIDIGPGAGEYGGEVMAEGTPTQIKGDNNSLTGKYLSGKLSIDPPKNFHKGNGKFLEVKGASAFNLKNIDVKFPLGKFICVTGVSGSGKSTLLTEILAKALSHHFYNTKELPAEHKEVKGLENIDKVIAIDQSPIGRTPRSNPATYTGLFNLIRDLFCELPESKKRGYKAGHFSFNVAGGRCETCHGDGMIKIEMNFLSDVYVECEECKGKRYTQGVLDVSYKDKSISDVLNMTVEESRHFFADIPSISEKLKTLYDVGLGYIKLGQSATTLSGGEAQRVKLATELSRRATSKTLYILDEPTTGLHFDDIKRLLFVLGQLVDKGSTVLVVEHNMDVIKSADWVIDLGPDGGDKGGNLVAEGTPRDVAKVKASYTGQYLKKIFG